MDSEHRDFLAVDVTRGDTHVEFNKQSTTAEAVDVIVLISLIYIQKGFTNLTFLLDNARIHGAKMEVKVQQLLAQIALQRTTPTVNVALLAHARLFAQAKSCGICYSRSAPKGSI